MLAFSKCIINRYLFFGWVGKQNPVKSIQLCDGSLDDVDFGHIFLLPP
jgi:hypothetical protein